MSLEFDVSNILLEMASPARIEKEIQKGLTKMNGNIERTSAYLQNRYTPEEIQAVLLRMEEEGKTFNEDPGIIIDDAILNQIDKEDIMFDNENVVVVEVKSHKKSQFYGRDTWSKGGRGSPWSISHPGREGERSWNMYAYYGDGYATMNDMMSKFYVVLPKKADIVPHQKYAKVLVQASVNRTDVWSASDEVMSDIAVDSLFDSWGIPWEGRGRGME